MSKYLIIFANPSHEGHGGYILKKIEERLKDSSIDYSVIDLYQAEYSPVLKPEESRSLPERIVAPETTRYQEKISQANRLIFIYPVWWQNMPAILKGFIDRTLSSGFAFKYLIGLPVPLLKGKKAAVFCTTASPQVYSSIFKRQQAANILSRDALNFCGISSKNFLFGGARKLESNRSKLDRVAEQIINYLK